MVKLFKCCLLFLSISTFFIIGFFSEISASDFPEKEKKEFLSGCIRRGLERGADPDYVNNFCKCSWEVQATNMTYEEYKEMKELAMKGKKPDEIPQLVRIMDKLQECKSPKKHNKPFNK